MSIIKISSLVFVCGFAVSVAVASPTPVELGKTPAEVGVSIYRALNNAGASYRREALNFYKDNKATLTKLFAAFNDHSSTRSFDLQTIKNAISQSSQNHQISDQDIHILLQKISNFLKTPAGIIVINELNRLLPPEHSANLIILLKLETLSIETILQSVDKMTSNGDKTASRG